MSKNLTVGEKGSLVAECGSAKFLVESKENTIQIDIAGLQDARHLYKLKSVPLRGAGRLGLSLHNWLIQSRLTVRVRYKGKPLAKIGAAAKPSLLGHLMGFPGLEMGVVNSIRVLTGLHL